MSLNGIRSEIGGAQILLDLGALNQTASRLAQTYISLGGDRSLSWPDTTSPAVVADDLREKVGAIIDDTIRNTTKGLSAHKYTKDGLSVGTYYISSAEYAFATVLVEANDYVTLELKHLEKLKQRKKLYDLLRRVILSLYETGLTLSEDECFTDRYADYLSELSADEPHTAKEVHDSVEKIRTFMQYDKQPSRKQPSIEDSYAALKRCLSAKQRAWIENAIVTSNGLKSFWRQWRSSPAQQLFWNVVDNSVQFESLVLRPSFNSSFYILWDLNSHSHEIFVSDINSMINEYGSPCKVFNIQTSKDLHMACGFIEHTAMLQQLFCEFKEVFFEKYRDRKRTV